jgi:hypothetical protein
MNYANQKMSVYSFLNEKDGLRFSIYISLIFISLTMIKSKVLKYTLLMEMISNS